MSVLIRRLILSPLFFLIVIVVIILGEIYLFLYAGIEAIFLDGLRGEISGEFQERNFINGVFGEGCFEPIIEIAHVIQVSL